MAFQRQTEHAVRSVFYLAKVVVDHNVVRLDISMHDAFRVTEIERLTVI